MLSRPEGIPSTSGIYVFRDGAGTPVYVGKAKSLSSRLGGYFQKSNRAAKTTAILTAAKSVEWIVTSSEVDALLLENEFIKQYQPRFNTRLKDDKSYPYLALDHRPEFAWPFVTRSAHQRGVEYFGPFGHVKSLRRVLDEALKIAPLRSCSPSKFASHVRRSRPCLLFDIGKCSGPCIGAVSESDYQDLVVRFEDLFRGRSDEIRHRLQGAMNDASERLDYERAARARDSLAALDVVQVEQRVVLPRPSGLDVIAVKIDGLRAVVTLIAVRNGRIVATDNALFDLVSDDTPDEAVERFCLDRFSASRPPASRVVMNLALGQTTLADYLSSIATSPVRLTAPRGAHERALIAMAEVDATSKLQRDSLRRQADHNVRSQALVELGIALGLAAPPYRIECFDMSHLQGTNYVGSMVVAIDAIASKSQYRHFSVKSVLGNNDVGAMYEVLTRRLRYWNEPTAAFPRADLIIVDGGLPQIGAALDAIRDTGLEGLVEVAALAKREELLYRPGSSEPIRLDRGSEALYLVQRLRDEAHRFAITFHRSRRGKAMVSGALDGVPGIGPKRQAWLLEEFGSMKAIRSASVEALENRGKLSPRVAATLYAHLHAGAQPRLERGGDPDD